MDVMTYTDARKNLKSVMDKGGERLLRSSDNPPQR